MVLEATSRSQPGTATRGKTNSSNERRLRGRLDWRIGRWRGAWARGEGGGRSVRGAGNYPGPLSGPRRCSPDTLGWEESGLLEPEGNVGRLYTGCLPVHRSSFFFLAAIDEPWTSFASLDQPKTPQPGATLIRRRIRGHSSCCTDPNFRSRIPRDRQARKKAIGRFYRFKNMKAIWLMVLLAGVAVDAQRRLALPDPRSCANRVRHASYRDARGVAHSYFFSWEHQPTRSLEVDWLDSRNICRRHCMDAVSLETPQENEFIKQRVVRGNVRYIWTSGRKCNFNGCDRPDLQPQNVNGWFWSGSGAKIGPTSQRNSGDWSNTGGYGQPQPDNREAAQGNDESCLSILNNFYNDGIKWHDVACHHRKPFVCEDSDELLNFVASRNPGIRL